MATMLKYEDKDLKVVGTRPIRPDGVDKVTGRARYGADINLPGQLFGRLLRGERKDPLGVEGAQIPRLLQECVH